MANTTKLDGTNWQDYNPTEKQLKKSGDKVVFKYEGECVKRKDVKGYFNKTFYSAYRIFIRMKNLNCCNGRGWGNELYTTMRIWDIFHEEESKHNVREIKKIRDTHGSNGRRT